MSWTPWLSSLNDVMADLYPTFDEARKMVLEVGLKPSYISLEGTSSVIRWFNIVKYINDGWGEKPGIPPRAMKLVELALGGKFPEHPILTALKNNEPPVVEVPKLNLAPPNVDDGEHYEKITGSQNTLLPIRFLEIGTQRARAVARIVRGDGSGTGFLIGNGWLLTNNHVLPNAALTANAIAEFNYQQASEGLDCATERFKLDAARFRTSIANDWSAVGIDAAAEAKWGAIPLEPVDVAVDAFVNIIQHPGGGQKQIGLYHNTVAAVGDGRVQYLTDTLPGSSGSPVFDSAWKVVALHHSGGMLRVPGTKQRAYLNEGIAVRTVIDDLRAAGVL
ncbi:MAG: serine protease [Acidobacteria bacterium]|nr:MAG: serine protease [Acidobacteriota bacterium]